MKIEGIEPASSSRRGLGRAFVALLVLGAATAVAPAAAQADEQPALVAPAMVGCGQANDTIVLEAGARGNDDPNFLIDRLDPPRVEYSVALAEPLAPGIYAVSSISGDDHFTKPEQDQIGESYWIRIGDARTPGEMPDIPTDKDWQGSAAYADDDQDMSTVPEAVMADPGYSLGDVAVTQPADTITFVHPADGDTPDSVQPQFAIVNCVSPDVSLTKSVDGNDSDDVASAIEEEITIDETFTWVIDMVNTGERTATGIDMCDTMPPGVVVTDAWADDGDVDRDGRTVCWSGDLDPGEAVAVAIEANVDDRAEWAECLAGDETEGDDRCTNRATIMNLDQVDPTLNDHTDTAQVFTPAPAPTTTVAPTTVPPTTVPPATVSPTTTIPAPCVPQDGAADTADDDAASNGDACPPAPCDPDADTAAAAAAAAGAAGDDATDPAVCPPPTSEAPPATVTPTTAPPTTAAPTPESPTPTVLGKVQTPTTQAPTTSVPAQPQTLPITGSDTATLIGLGALLIAIGMALFSIRSRTS